MGESFADQMSYWRKLHFELYLHGNPLVCDDKLAWLIEFVKAGHVKETFWDTSNPREGPFISTCAAPEKHAGVALKNVKFD
uniref:LRRCT domain-containing protein n=1 Tax=Panagrellus redivivus TaxID=6233 RepID=A0A7E4V0N1_PANRE